MASCTDCSKHDRPCSKCRIEQPPVDDKPTVYIQGASVVHKRQTFDRDCPCPCKPTSAIWQCYIGVTTNNRGCSYIDLRTVGYYQNSKEREIVRAAVAAVEADGELHALLCRTVDAVNNNCILLTAIRNECLNIRAPDVFRIAYPENIDFWTCQNTVVVTRRGGVHVKHFTGPRFTGPHLVGYNKYRSSVTYAMSEVSRLIDTYDGTGFPSWTLYEARCRSEKLRENTLERLLVLGDAFAAKIRLYADL